MSQPTCQVHGHHVFNKPATLRIKTYSTLVDFFCVSMIWSLTLSLFQITLYPSVKLLLGLLGVTVLYVIPQKILFGLTFGQRIWQLRPHQNTWYQIREVVYQPNHVTQFSVFISSLLSATALLISIFFFQHVALSHPLWTQTSLWKLEPFVPNPEEWVITPFFYALGGWPKFYQGQPIFYKLAYEKGPPSQFVGHIYGYWEAPDIQIIMEGPKTPPSARDQAEIKKCIAGGFSYSCLVMKDTVLTRHINEMASISPKKWTVQWFNVNYPFLPSEEQTQGVYLSAQGENSTQDRFILINSRGKHQALILSRPNSQQGEKAFQLVQKIVRSIRNFSELDSGKAWINRELEKIQLNDLNSVSDPIEIASRLAIIQTLLISKISVEPANFDSYFHLAGTSFMLSKISKNNHDIRNAAALQNLQNSYRYVTDINLKDPRTTQIQNLWLESRKD